jgi:hypothetical protein
MARTMNEPLQTQVSTDATDNRRLKVTAWVVLIQLAALAFHRPAIWVAMNSRSFPDLREATLVSLGSLLGALLLMGSLTLLGLARVRALGVVSALLIIFWNWQSLNRPIAGLPGLAVAAVLSVMLISGAYRQAGMKLFRVSILSLAFVLVGVSALVYLARTSRQTASHVVMSTETVDSTTLSRRPDFFILLLDGYARSDVLAELYAYDNRPFEEELRSAHFQIAGYASTNYSTTHFALASMFQMDYLMEPGPSVTRSDLVAIRTILAGENTTVSLLKDLGYRYVQGSEEWWGTRCSHLMDECLPNPFLGATAYELLAGTPLEPLTYADTGNRATAITLMRLEQIREWGRIGSSLSATSPTFAFIHISLPHPPLFLDSTCRPRLHPLAGGRILNQHPSILPEILEWRKAAYVEQIECANLVARALVESIPEDSVAVILSDHGPDSHGQLQRQPASIDRVGAWERMSTLAAIRLPSDCSEAVPADLTIVNVMPVILNCVFGTSLPLREARFFLAPDAGTEAPLFQIHDPDQDYSEGSW